LGTDGTTRPLARRGRRAILLGAALVTATWLGLRIVPMVVSRVGAARELLASRQELLYRMQLELGGLDALADTARQLQAQVVALAPRILTGTSSADATADLVARITLVANRSRVKLTGADPVLDSAAAGGLRRVAVRASVEGDIRGVIELLRGLERDPGALLLDDLRVLALEPTSEEHRPEVLRVELAVYGWHQVRERAR